MIRIAAFWGLYPGPLTFGNWHMNIVALLEMQGQLVTGVLDSAQALLHNTLTAGA